MSVVVPSRTTVDISRRTRLPAWLFSLVLHLVVLLTLSVWKAADPRGFPNANRPGIELTLGNANSGQTEYLYFTASSSQPAAGGGAESSAASALPSDLPDTSNHLPGLPTTASASDSGSQGVDIGLPSAGDFTGSGQPGRTFGTDGQTSTGVFGAVGTGSKFVYVFDRSASMGDLSGRPLRAAKSQLIKSLEQISDIHQFQIVFYNEKPSVFNPNAPRQPRMLFGDDQSKRLAENFVDGITAIGGTQHWEALKLAMAMRPDVIFFLSDGVSNPLTKQQLNQIQLMHEKAGTSINVIEFGSGPSTGRVNFLQQLARQTQGQYVYVDMTKLSSESTDRQ